MWDKVLKGLCAAAGAIAGLLGEWNVLLSVLAGFMVIDYATGLICAWRGRSPKTDGGGVSSRVGFDGLARKGLIILIVLMATLTRASPFWKTARCWACPIRKSS